MPNGVATTAATTRPPTTATAGRAARASGPRGDPVAEHDVQDEAEAVRRGPGEPGRAARRSDLGQQGDAGARRGRAPQRCAGSARRTPRGRSTPRNSMLGHGRERCRDRGRGRRRRSSPARTTPRASIVRRSAGAAARSTVHGRRQTANDDGGRGEPQPGDPSGVDVGEEQDRERRAEVVERRAEHDGAEGRGRGAIRFCGGLGGDGLRTSAGHDSILESLDRRSEGLNGGSWRDLLGNRR